MFSFSTENNTNAVKVQVRHFGPRYVHEVSYFLSTNWTLMPVKLMAIFNLLIYVYHYK